MSDKPALTPTALLEQEARLVFDRFDHECSWQLGCSLVARAREEALPIAIGIRRNGQTLFAAAMPGTSADSDTWLARKARVTDRFGHSSLYVRQLILAEGTPTAAERALPTESYALFGGSFPIFVSRAGHVGTVAVTGLDQLSDHLLVVDALAAHRARHYDGTCQAAQAEGT